MLGVILRLPVALAVATAILMLMGGCGQASQQLLTPAQVQKSLTHAGLQTGIVFDCFATRSACPTNMLRAFGAPHLVGMVADKRHSVSKTNIESSLEAWILDSTRAANDFNRGTYLDASGKKVSPFLRLQRRNVVVKVSGGRDYRRKAKAAVAALS
jgi:hypothetical protein